MIDKNKFLKAVKDKVQKRIVNPVANVMMPFTKEGKAAQKSKTDLVKLQKTLSDKQIEKQYPKELWNEKKEEARQKKIKEINIV